MDYVILLCIIPLVAAPEGQQFARNGRFVARYKANLYDRINSPLAYGNQ